MVAAEDRPEFAEADGVYWRWLPRHDVDEPGAPLVWPTNAPALEPSLQVQLIVHTAIDGLTVLDESTDSFTLKGPMPLLALKGDPKFSGAHLYYVRHRGHLIRIALETPTHVLAVAHPSLGKELGFSLLTFPDRAVLGSWLPRGEVQRAAIEQTMPPVGSPATAPSRKLDLDQVVFTSSETGERILRVESQTETTLTLVDRGSSSRDEALVAAGFTVKENWHGGSWVNDYEPSVSYDHSLVIDKRDTRLVGFQRPEDPRADELLMDAVYQELGVVGIWMFLQSETPDLFEFHLRLDSKDSRLVAAGCDCLEGYDDRAGDHVADHTLTTAKTAREVTGAGELFLYKGYQLRGIAQRDGKVLLIAHFDLAWRLEFELYNLFAYRWIPDGDVKRVR